MPQGISVRLKWRGNKKIAEISEALFKGIVKAADLYRFDLKAALLTKRGNKKIGLHSKPGEIPYWITGDYARSIRVQKFKGKTKHTVKIVILQHKQRIKGSILEKGNFHIAERPHWRVIFNKNKNKMKAIIKAVAKSKLSSLGITLE